MPALLPSCCTDDNILATSTGDAGDRNLWLTLTSTSTDLVVDVRACAQARLYMYAIAEEDPPSYVIVLGAKSNTVSQVRGLHI